MLNFLLQYSQRRLHHAYQLIAANDSTSNLLKTAMDLQLNQGKIV